MSQISYDEKPKLYLIPTPIGNMDDITLRAINTLKEVEVVFCEDTRETMKLLNYLNIKKKLIASHEHNEATNEKKLLEYLNNGYNVGLVSDRGTPVISDPGYVLSKIAIENNYNVVALPGATALIPALISSGIEPMPFLYYGFLNSKSSQRKKELEKLKNETATLIIYESPHRIKDTLKDLLILGENRRIAVVRELTKKHEEIIRTTIGELNKSNIELIGELVLVIEGNKEVENYDNLTIEEHIELYIKDGLKPMDAIKKVAADRNLKKSIVYDEYLKRKSDIMKLVVGLGNPGKEYTKTRHNVGFRMIDKIASDLNITIDKNKFDGLYGEKIINGEKYLFLKPQRYMNLSGTVIQEYLNYFKINPSDLLVICDDLDMEVGRIRLRSKGSSGGHNGLKDIEKNIGTSEYKRIKIGIANNKNMDTKDYVLGKFSKEEDKIISECENTLGNIFKDYPNLNFEQLMSKYN